MPGCRAHAGLVPDDNATSVMLTPRDYGSLAEQACSIPLEEYPEAFPGLAEEYYPFWCMDTTYMFLALTQVKHRAYSGLTQQLAGDMWLHALSCHSVKVGRLQGSACKSWLGSGSALQARVCILTGRLRGAAHLPSLLQGFDFPEDQPMTALQAYTYHDGAPPCVPEVTHEIEVSWAPGAALAILLNWKY